MTKITKKARSTAATEERTMEPGTNNHESPESTLEFTTTSSRGQTGIASLLSHGQENAVPLRHLKAMVNLPGREVRRQIERERRSGALICSNNKDGYYIASDAAEAKRFALSMKHRAQQILLTAAAIEEAAGLD